MGPEGLVFSRKERVDQLGREIDEAQLHAAFARIARHDLSIGPAHHRGQRRLVGQQRVRRRQRPLDRHPQQPARHHQYQNQPEQTAQPARAGHAAAQTAPQPATAEPQVFTNTTRIIAAGIIAVRIITVGRIAADIDRGQVFGHRRAL
jgi:hypothetical protein